MIKATAILALLAVGFIVGTIHGLALDKPSMKAAEKLANSIQDLTKNLQLILGYAAYIEKRLEKEASEDEEED